MLRTLFTLSIVGVLNFPLVAHGQEILLECSGVFYYTTPDGKGQMKLIFPVAIDRNAGTMLATPFLPHSADLTVAPHSYGGSIEGRYCFSTSTRSILEDRYCGEGVSVVSVDRATLKTESAFISSDDSQPVGVLNGKCRKLELAI